jgi:hypothetical protein
VKRAAVIALCLLTQACVSGRDYQVPKQAVALSPSANTPFVAGGETAFAGSATRQVVATIMMIAWMAISGGRLQTPICVPLTPIFAELQRRPRNRGLPSRPDLAAAAQLRGSARSTVRFLAPRAIR